MSSKHLSSLVASAILAILAAIALWILPACDQRSPSSPSGDLTNAPWATPTNPPEPTESSPQPTTPSAPAPPSCQATIEGDQYVLRCGDGLGEDHELYAVCYKCPDGSCQQDMQFRFSLANVRIRGDQSRTLSIGLPECGFVQCDGTFDVEPPPTYIPPDKLEGYIDHSGEIRNRGECPEECQLTQRDCPPGFTFDQRSCSCQCLQTCFEPWVVDLESCSCVCPVTCEEPFVLNSEDCSCECGITECVPGWTLDREACECLPCEPVGEPECPEQEWSEQSCSWVGECPCQEQECPSGYSWEGEPVCDCVCSLECPPDYHLDDQACECICDPVGEPECPEQEWSTETCSWEGDCEDCCDTLEGLGKFEIYVQHPPGSPADECAELPLLFGHDPMVPDEGGELLIRKGGHCYEMTSECDPGPATHGPPKVCCDVPLPGGHSFRWCYAQSHVTRCTCEE